MDVTQWLPILGLILGTTKINERMQSENALNWKHGDSVHCYHSS